jgi:NADP-dependent 3-hydroxy acid dehydrogenase YdfG
MEHSIALITGTTSGLGYAAARSLARFQETAAQLAAETKTQVFTPLELDLNARLAFSPRSPSWSSEVGASISYCSMPGWSQVRSACSLRRASRLLRPR